MIIGFVIYQYYTYIIIFFYNSKIWLYYNTLGPTNLGHNKFGYYNCGYHNFSHKFRKFLLDLGTFQRRANITYISYIS